MTEMSELQRNLYAKKLAITQLQDTINKTKKTINTLENEIREIEFSIDTRNKYDNFRYNNI